MQAWDLSLKKLWWLSIIWISGWLAHQTHYGLLLLAQGLTWSDSCWLIFFWCLLLNGTHLPGKPLLGLTWYYWSQSVRTAVFSCTLVKYYIGSICQFFYNHLNTFMHTASYAENVLFALNDKSSILPSIPSNHSSKPTSAVSHTKQPAK